MSYDNRERATKQDDDRPLKEAADFVLRVVAAAELRHSSLTPDEIVEGVRALRVEAIRLRDAIRAHRDQKGDDRCWEDDLKLYAVLPEGVAGADLRLPPPEEMLANCQRYVACRHNPAEPYVSPQREVERLIVLLHETTTPVDPLTAELCNAIGDLTSSERQAFLNPSGWESHGGPRIARALASVYARHTQEANRG